ncbi:MerR family DNA-binding transcriptional regulator [Shouchella miscanthi]|uniref:MerR family DNA-binding transcriptional regulator n=1 Tax=Shouchella miscanthi TaxID=2598861 RepID=A0ABU6NN45_9BACI|nr:MerR family DNA-binding transcriptional regulator [Shouchella miscanthi]MED4129606.1 MerR family DNA-binding transcriptional regulator [Shouchella miscanthi]
MKIGEVSSQARISSSTLRYWEKKGYITSSRNENNKYRFFNSFQYIKILLMKLIQNAIYSNEVVEIKNSVRSLEDGDIEEARKIVVKCQQYLENRNKEQLHGLYFLYRLCSKLDLI